MADRLVITFKGKIDGDGDIKVPKLTASHVSALDRGTCATLIMSTRDSDIFNRLLQNMYRAAINDKSAYWPTYVNADTPGFTFTPQANGFMANASITLDARAYRGIKA